MGRLINLITGTKTDVVGKRQDTNVTAGKPTHAMRMLHIARFLLARLAERLGAGQVTAQWCHAVGVTSAAPSLERSYSSGLRPRSWRQSRPGSSVPVSRF